MRRSKSQNISALALSLNRYHKSATPPFYSDIQSDTSFLVILRNNKQKTARQYNYRAAKTTLQHIGHCVTAYRALRYHAAVTKAG